jgi:DNA-binding MarR family transcriptional regulator
MRVHGRSQAIRCDGCVVETLRKRGWVRKTPDATDVRATTVAITHTDRAQVGPAYDAQVDGARRILFDHINRADAEQLDRPAT